jgi:hypothetical protein
MGKFGSVSKIINSEERQKRLNEIDIELHKLHKDLEDILNKRDDLIKEKFCINIGVDKFD